MEEEVKNLEKYSLKNDNLIPNEETEKIEEDVAKIENPYKSLLGIELNALEKISAPFQRLIETGKKIKESQEFTEKLSKEIFKNISNQKTEERRVNIEILENLKQLNNNKSSEYLKTEKKQTLLEPRTKKTIKSLKVSNQAEIKNDNSQQIEKKENVNISSLYLIFKKAYLALDKINKKKKKNTKAKEVMKELVMNYKKYDTGEIIMGIDKDSITYLGERGKERIFRFTKHFDSVISKIRNKQI